MYWRRSVAGFRGQWMGESRLDGQKMPPEGIEAMEG